MIFSQAGDGVAGMAAVVDLRLVEEVITAFQDGYHADPAVVHGNSFGEGKCCLEHLPVEGHATSHERIIHPIPQKTPAGIILLKKGRMQDIVV